MISYFKYTNGEAFLLNKFPYTGFFTVIDGKAYTGKIKDDNSEELTPKKTFIADFYLKKMEFDNQYGDIEDINPPLGNVFDILDADNIRKFLTDIDNNNSIVFKSLVIANPQILNFDENECHFYGLSSTPAYKPADAMYPKNVFAPIDPFSYFPEWEFLDNIVAGAFLVDSDQSFKYVCSTGYDLITISGSFTNKNILTYKFEDFKTDKEIFQIIYDEYDNKLLIVLEEELKVYDAENFIKCNVLLLIDSIKLENTIRWNIKRKFKDADFKWDQKFFNVTFGNNFRVSVLNGVLVFWKKYSSTIVATINIKDKYNIKNVIGLDMRFEDDYMVLLHKDGSTFKVTFFDISDIDNTIKTTDITNLKGTKNYQVGFFPSDSNIFILSNDKEYQMRFISNPENAVAKMREKNLKYYNPTWSKTFQFFKDSIFRWNSSKMESNSYNNYINTVISKNNKNYYLLHNSGRIYALKQNIENIYESAVDLNTEKTFDGLNCSNSSLGLLLNKIISSILKDILVLYNNSKNSYLIDIDEVFIQSIEEIAYDNNNLYINGNETFNIIPIQRILTLLIDLQKKLIAKISSKT